MSTTSTDGLQVVVTPDTAADTTAASVEDAADAFSERLFTSGLAALELAAVDLGRRLDLYRPLRGHALAGPELAARRQVAPRYAREWLEQQAVAGILVCEDPGDEPDRRRYLLPEAHARCLLDPEDPVFVAACAAFPSPCAARCRRLSRRS